MRTIATVGIGLCLTAMLSFGLTRYRGQLIDASCYNQNPSTSGEKVWVRCAPTDATTTFAIHTNGKVRMLNAAGNDKVLAAYQSGNLMRDRNGDMPVIVDGYRHGNTIAVEGIRGHKSKVSVH